MKPCLTTPVSNRLLFGAAVLLLAACGPSPRQRIAARLDDVESYINERPDSALAVLRALDADSLCAPSQRARAALLHQMALDKCYIDITSDSVLSPAFWYLKHGSADHKLKTWYYRSVLARNAGDIDTQMLYLVRGEQYIPRAKDPLMAGFIYTAKRVIFLHLYDLENAVSNAEKAVISFREAENWKRYYDALLGLANITNMKGEYALTKNALDTLAVSWQDLTAVQKGKAFGVELKYRTETEQDLAPFIEQYLAALPPSQIEWERVARAYLVSGQPLLAEEALDRVRSDRSPEEEIAYQNTRYRIFEALGQVDAALEARRQYTRLFDRRVENSLTSRARFATEEETYRQDARALKLRIVILVLGCMVLCFVLMSVYIFFRRKVRVQRQNEESLQARLKTQMDQVRSLRRENGAAWNEVRRLESILQQQTLPQSIRTLITDRIAILNEYGVRVLSGKQMQASLGLKERLQLDDKQQFIQRLYDQFCVLNPRLMAAFGQRHLSGQEKICCALLCTGLKTGDIAQFLELSERRCYNICNSVRAKMGWKGDSRTLQAILSDYYPD